MKILFDHQTFTHQDFGGISRYFFELASNLISFPSVEVQSSILFSNNDYIKGNKLLPSKPYFPGKRIKGKKLSQFILNEWYSKRVIRKNKFDIFHPTYYDTYHQNIKISKPVVVTCLGMIHEKFIKDDVKTLNNKKVMLHRADKILAISENTKNDVVEYFGISPDKIAVTYLASSLVSDNLPPKDNSVPYFLYIGMRNFYKNFPAFIRAMAPILVRHPELYLYCAGGGYFDKDELNVLRENKILERVKYFRVTDDSLRKLYRSAIAFVFPSLYEGFGIPVLEAMSCGCPVAISRSSSLTEVGGDAAAYFDPTSIESMQSTMESLLNDSALREELSVKGFARSKEFSWKKTASDTYEVYRTLI